MGVIEDEAAADALNVDAGDPDADEPRESDAVKVIVEVGTAETLTVPAEEVDAEAPTDKVTVGVVEEEPANELLKVAAGDIEALAPVDRERVGVVDCVIAELAVSEDDPFDAIIVGENDTVNAAEGGKEVVTEFVALAETAVAVALRLS